MSRRSWLNARAGIKVAVVVTTAAVVSTLLGACGSGAGDTDEIVIGTIMPLSGPQEPLSVSSKSMQSYFDRINEAGGISGRSVKLVVRDDQFNPANTPAVARQLVEQDRAVLLCDNQGSGPLRAIAPYLQSKKIPSIAAAGDSSLFTPDSTLFQMLAPYEYAGAHLARYAVEDFHAKRIAIVYSEDGSGLPWRSGALEQLRAMGVQPVAEVKVNLTAKDQAPAAAALREAGADFVMFNHTAPIVTQVVRAAERIGYTPQWAFNASAMNQQIIDLGGPTINGALFVTQFPAPASEALAEYRKALDTDNPGVDQTDAIAVHGWISAKLCTDAIERAMDAAGGKMPTPEQIQASIEQTQSDDDLVGGLVWNETERLGPAAQHILQLEGHEFIEVQEYRASPHVATLTD